MYEGLRARSGTVRLYETERTTAVYDTGVARLPHTTEQRTLWIKEPVFLGTTMFRKEAQQFNGPRHKDKWIYIAPSSLRFDRTH